MTMDLARVGRAKANSPNPDALDQTVKDCTDVINSPLKLNDVTARFVRGSAYKSKGMLAEALVDMAAALAQMDEEGARAADGRKQQLLMTVQEEKADLMVQTGAPHPFIVRPAADSRLPQCTPIRGSKTLAVHTHPQEILPGRSSSTLRLTSCSVSA